MIKNNKIYKGIVILSAFFILSSGFYSYGKDKLNFRFGNKYPIPREAYNRDFKGEGQVIAIIDSGADINNDAWQLTDKSTVKLDEATVNDIIAKEGLKGKYISPKLPYIHDYFHKDNNIKSYSEHGMHVAGIAGGNSKKFKGVAPESQLLLMKVFPDEGLNFTEENAELYIEAIKDAIKLKADVINLSLGAGAGSLQFVNPEMIKVVNEAEANGIIINIAAGNNGYFGFGQAYPRAENPDYGVIAMPAILDNVNAVASMDGDYENNTYVFVGENKFPYKVAYTDRLSIATPIEYGEDYEVINCGYGDDSDFEENNIANKIVIVERGKHTFRELQYKASSNGARGVIIFNNENNPDSLIELDGSEFSIPAFTMKYSDGINMINSLKSNDSIANFFEEELATDNPNKRKMNSFSSWGLTNESVFKPDITAPGGSIESLGNDNRYIRMSGTSMACPYISGVAALGLQRVKSQFPTLSPLEKLKLVNRLMYSTAREQQENGSITSPRKQGAGIVDIDGVVAGKVVAYSDENNYKINLGNVSNTLNIPMTFRNISNEDLTLSGGYVLIGDEVNNKRYTLKNKILKEDNLENIVLKPNEVKKINFKININDIDLINEQPNGYFIDGYIQYNYGEKAPTVSTAFTAFKGDYNNLPVVEKPIYDFDSSDSPSYYSKDSYENNFTHLGTDMVLGEDNIKHIVLGETSDSVIGNRKFDKEHIAISPNNGDGIGDNLQFVITTLRTFQKIEINIYDDNNRLVESFGNMKNPDFIKNYYGADYRQNMAINVWSFAGDTLNKLPEGKYKAEIKLWRFIDQGKKENQKIDYSFFIDKTIPRPEEVSIKDNRLIVKASDNLSGIKNITIKDGDKTLSSPNGDFNLEGFNKDNLYIIITDWAYNKYDFHYSEWNAKHNIKD